ncbi:uncharacterized protein ACNLHF_010530 [Anomaloglossus baeobatrachus]|uniref:uncharacterized protein LOC142302957 n=1 Tax=Anomaloglossus baeobatrachus TaxID=238106 RepID=UPI003F4F57E0
MADAVTYADLRFAEVPRPEKKRSETPHDRVSDFLDDTYENIDKPTGERKVPEAPPSGRWRRLQTGFRLWAPHLALLFLMLSLILSTITIERTIKYLHVSSELQALSASHQAMNRSLMEDMQSKDLVLSTLRRDLQNTEQRVKQLTDSTGRLAATLQTTDDKLQTQKNMTNKAQMELERAEKKLSEEQAKLNQQEREICPENWILVGSKCVHILDVEGSWTQCEKYCRNKDANLIVIPRKDLQLKDFLSNGMEDFWIGKEFRWKDKTRSWEWPDQYWIQRGNCWKISKRLFTSEKCTEKSKCVCEKNLILTTIKAYPHNNGYEGPYLVLWSTEYYCWGGQ